MGFWWEKGDAERVLPPDEMEKLAESEEVALQ